MKERGKQAVEAFSNDHIDFNFSAASETPCKKHTKNPSPVGICAYCLKDRLVKLVCSECGEQRLSSCSCSDVSSSYRNSCSTMEVGSVGRVSFLIENDKIDPPHIVNLNPRPEKGDPKPEQVVFLRRSTSSCVEVKKSNGFWRIKRLFRKKTKGEFGKNGEFCDEKSEIWVSDAVGVPRSRSLCSFRGFGRSDYDDENRSAFSSAKISDVTNGVFLDADRQFGGFRGTGRQNSVELSGMDESAFFDLKADLPSGFKEFSGARMSCGSDHGGGGRNERFGFGGSFANLKSSGVLGDGGSCRAAVDGRGMKKGGKSHKVWKWIFKYRPANKKEEK